VHVVDRLEAVEVEQDDRELAPARYESRNAGVVARNQIATPAP
jgi:hypothetical protein